MAEKLDARISSLIGGVAQLGERRVRNAKVRSSILLISTNLFKGLASACDLKHWIALHAILKFISQVQVLSSTAPSGAVFFCTFVVNGR